MGILIIILFVLFCLVILSIPSGLTYLLYRYLRKKGQNQRKIGLAIIIVTTILMVIYSIKFFMDGAGFGPKYETVEIDQNIGGKLICKSVYNADIHSLQFDVDYKYISINRDTIDMGYGSYYGREWKKDEQLIKFDNWLILKTGYLDGSDKVILKNIFTDSTRIYNFENHFIEKDSFWQALDIKSLEDYCCAETFIQRINDDEILLKYKFRTDEQLTSKYGERMIKYRIDKITGKIKMTKIE